MWLLSDITVKSVGPHKRAFQQIRIMFLFSIMTIFTQYSSIHIDKYSHPKHIHIEKCSEHTFQMSITRPSIQFTIVEVSKSSSLGDDVTGIKKVHVKYVFNTAQTAEFHQNSGQ